TGTFITYLLPSCPIPLHFFFSPVTAPPEIYTLSLHDALPISRRGRGRAGRRRRQLRLPARAVGPGQWRVRGVHRGRRPGRPLVRSEEHTSELQSRGHLVCRLLLEKKKTRITLAVQNATNGQAV